MRTTDFSWIKLFKALLNGIDGLIVFRYYNNTFKYEENRRRKRI